MLRSLDFIPKAYEFETHLPQGFQIRDPPALFSLVSSGLVTRYSIFCERNTGNGIYERQVQVLALILELCDLE